MGLWSAESETLGDVSTSTLLELGMSHVGKSTELAAAACWDLRLDLFGLHKSLGSLSTCTHGLGIVACIFFRLFLCFLAKHVFLSNLGCIPKYTMDISINSACFFFSFLCGY